MTRFTLLLPVVLSCIIILISSSFPIDLVFSSHDAEEIVILEFGEDFVPEESIYKSLFFIKDSSSKKHDAIWVSEKIKLQFKDVETPPPESQIA